MIDVAEIKIWGEQVGAVRWNPDRQVASFQYTNDFARNGQDLAPLKMPQNARNPVYSFSELSAQPCFSGLPGLIADALPDRYGNALIDTWLAQRGRSSSNMNPVEKLCFIGTRSMGALEFVPSMFKRAGKANLIEVDSLIGMAQRMLHQRESFHAHLHQYERQAMLDVLKIGTSAGGARPKAIIAYNKVSGEIRSGQAKAPKGFLHYLIKLDGVSDAQFGDSDGWGRVEMAYYAMARACEINISDSELLEEGERAHFLTRRFDRDALLNKHHVQTWCAMEHFDYNDVFSYSYEQLFRTMRSLRLHYPAAEQMFRRMVFNVLTKNCDDHTKNFSFLLKHNADWELAPAYDICHAYRPGSEWVSQQSLSVNGKRQHIHLDDFLAVANLINIRGARNIVSQIQGQVSRWNDYADSYRVKPELRDAILATFPTPTT